MFDFELQVHCTESIPIHIIHLMNYIADPAIGPNCIVSQMNLVFRFNSDDNCELNYFKHSITMRAHLLIFKK